MLPIHAARQPIQLLERGLVEAERGPQHTASLYEDLGTYQMIVGDRRVLSDNYIAPMGR